MVCINICVLSVPVSDINTRRTLDDETTICLYLTLIDRWNAYM